MDAAPHSSQFILNLLAKSFCEMPLYIFQHNQKSCFVMIDQSKCTGCGLCAAVCSVEAISVDETASVDVSVCLDCGACLDSCVNEAISLPD